MELFLGLLVTPFSFLDAEVPLNCLKSMNEQTFCIPAKQSLIVVRRLDHGLKLLSMKQTRTENYVKSQRVL